jgi:hypothetical protein
LPAVKVTGGKGKLYVVVGTNQVEWAPGDRGWRLFGLIAARAPE